MAKRSTITTHNRVDYDTSTNKLRCLEGSHDSETKHPLSTNLQNQADACELKLKQQIITRAPRLISSACKGLERNYEPANYKLQTLAAKRENVPHVGGVRSRDDLNLNYATQFAQWHESPR